MINKIDLFLRKIFENYLEEEKIKEALSFKENQKLALLGDKVLDLILIEHEYNNPKANSESIHIFKEKHHRRKENQILLKRDECLSNYILNNDYEQNPQNKIGVIRSDRYIEALIGVIYHTNGLNKAREFVKEIYVI